MGGSPPIFSVCIMPSRLLHPALLFCVLAVAAACYLPGLTGSFIFDDGVNIIANPWLRIGNLSLPALWQAAHSGNAGPLMRPLSMMSFALEYYAAGMDAYHFKLINLGIHLLNGLLIFVFSRLLLSLHHKVHCPDPDAAHHFWVPLAVAAIWLLHPFNLTGVLYVVQRMTSLSALFVLSGLIVYLRGRARLLRGDNYGFAAIAASFLVFTPLATLSKENGALLPLLALLMEATLLRWHTAQQASRKHLAWLVGAAAIIPVIAGTGYLLWHPDLIGNGYLLRGFSLWQRLMTEARVLWFYLWMIVLPNMSQMGLHHDDFLVSRSLLSPLTTLPAIFGLALLVGAGIAVRKKHPLLTFGMAFFLLGQLLESTIIPLEIAFEHRNYLPMLGILLPLTYYALSPQYHPASVKLRRLAFLALLCLFAGLTALRSAQWGDPLLMRTLEVQRHPRSIRANTDMAALYNYLPARSPDEALQYYLEAIAHYQQAADISPLNISGLMGVLVVNAERNIAPDPALIDMLEKRLATVPLNPPNINAIIGVARCVANGKCPVSREIVARFYRATSSNSTLAGGNKILALAELDAAIRKANSEGK